MSFLKAVKNYYTRKQCKDFIAACGEIGPDPTSQHFAERYKTLAFVYHQDGEWHQLDQDHVVQPAEYNDFSGGYKRYYRQMPKSYLESPLVRQALDMKKDHFNIPEGELIITQIMRCHFKPEDTQEGVSKCITGQGVHTDGSDAAMIAILERDNVKGAANFFSYDIGGEIQDEHMKSTVYQVGDVLLWNDNKIYHDVTRAELLDPTKEGTRAILVTNYPAAHYITGTTNPNNTLTTRAEDDSKKLRTMEDDYNNSNLLKERDFV